jgi:hypothetical protein
MRATRRTTALRCGPPGEPRRRDAGHPADRGAAMPATRRTAVVRCGPHGGPGRCSVGFGGPRRCGGAGFATTFRGVQVGGVGRSCCPWPVAGPPRGGRSGRRRGPGQRRVAEPASRRSA